MADADPPRRAAGVPVVELVWLALALVLPWAMNPWGLSPFALPKALLLQTGAALALALCWPVLRASGDPSSAARRTALVGVGALALALVAATAFALDPQRSLSGSLERMQGLPVLLALLALVLVTALRLRTHEALWRLLAVLAIGSVPVVAYALLQRVGIDPLGWSSDARSPVTSSLGRAHFVGSYLLLVIPATLALALRATSRSARLVWMVLLAAQLVTLLATEARSAWIGLAAGALVFAAINARSPGRRLRVGIAVGVAALFLVLALSWPSTPEPQSATLQAGEQVGATITRVDQGSVAARLTLWRFALPRIAERPWLGYGPDNFALAFAQVFPPQLVYYVGRDVSVDRSHNLVLDLAVVAGLAGIAGALLLLCGFAGCVRKVFRVRHADAGSMTALLAALSGLLVDQQFSVLTNDVAALAALLLGAGVGLAVPSERAGVGPAGLQPTRLVLVVAALAFSALQVPLLVADTLAWHARQATTTAENAEAMARRSVELAPTRPEYRMGLAWLQFRRGDAEAAESELMWAQRLSPADPRLLAALGELQAVRGERERSHLLRAEASYRRALELAPHMAMYHTALGLILEQQGRIDEAHRSLARAVDLDDTDAVARGHLQRLRASVTPPASDRPR